MLTARLWRKFDRGFSQIWQQSSNLNDRTATSYKVERNFSKWSIIKHKIQSTVPRGRQTCPCILPVDNDNTQLLTYKEAIKEYVVKRIGKQYLKGMPSSELLNVVLLCFWILSCLWYLSCVAYPPGSVLRNELLVDFVFVGISQSALTHT